VNLFDRALEAFDRALTIEPAFFEVLYNRGKLLNDVGRLEEALASYDKCLELMPGFVEALNRFRRHIEAAFTTMHERHRRASRRRTFL
jgi:tetratricopeptide (TPR) repeat protein